MGGRTCGLSKRYQPVRSCTFTPYVVTDYEYDPELPASSSGLVNANSASFLGSSNSNLLYIREHTNDTLGFYSDLNQILMKFQNSTAKLNDDLQTNVTELIKSNDVEKTTLKP